MRGGPAPMARGGPAVRPSNEATARPYSHPSPYGGWNARGNLANMNPAEAIQMDNIFPGVQNVEFGKDQLIGKRRTSDSSLIVALYRTDG
jgi:hypothetical protein